MNDRLPACHKPRIRRVNRRFRVWFPVALVCVLAAASCTAAGVRIKKNGFFSYKRYFLNQAVTDQISGDGRPQRELKKFADNYTKGLYAFSAGRMEDAKKDMLIARDGWPEYFGTDFILALIYEEQGLPHIAARYYKSYLNKLNALHTGKYRISEPVIRSFTPRDIETYDTAYVQVKTRLAGYGIDLDKVRPVFTFPVFLFPALVGMAIAAVYILIFHWIRPRLKRRHWIKHPPEGFWVCRNCDTANPNLAMECIECGKPRG